MDKKNIIPQSAKPVVRVTQGNLLAELSEEVLSGTEGITPSAGLCVCACCACVCSMDEDAE